MVLFILLLCVFFFVILISIYENTHFKVKKYNIKDDYFKDKSVRIIFISDLHDCKYGKDNEKLINEIDKQKPDLILIGGDVFNGIVNKNNKNAKLFVRKISEKYQVLYALGNHEYRFYLYPDSYPGYREEFECILRECNITLLDNSVEKIELKGIQFSIFGLSIERKYYKRFKNIKMTDSYTKNVLPERDENVYSILLAHNPKYFKEYSEFGAQLILSGHYHGGLIRFGKQGVVSPTFRLFPKYSYGFIENNKSKMIVSGGLGIHTIRFRVFNRPELVVIDFNNKG